MQVVLHEECLPSFPAWKGQVESLAEKLKDGGLETTLKEIKVLWKDWTREAAKNYLAGEEIRYAHIIIISIKNVILSVPHK